MFVRCIHTIGSRGIHHPPGSILDLPEDEIPRLLSLGAVEEMVQPSPPSPPTAVVEPIAPPAGNSAPRGEEQVHQPESLLPDALAPTFDKPPAPKKKGKHR